SAAVTCALAIQRALHRLGQQKAELDALRLRMGISYGSVLAVGGELYGGPLNVAARLEALAEPGGVVVSGSVFERVGELCEASFALLGVWKLNKLRTPCRVYSVW